MRMFWRKNKEKKEVLSGRQLSRLMQGMVPGGIYTGIMCVEGDLRDGNWTKHNVDNDDGTKCPACEKAKMSFWYNGKRYKYECDECHFIYDVGRRL